MTLICARLSKSCTVHATDSLLTSLEDDDSEHVIAEGSGKPKIVKVSKYRGAMSWWGSVQHNMGEGHYWNALEWMQQMSEESKNSELSVDDFAQSLADRLSMQFREYLRLKGRHRALGLHFTVYETREGKDIPELFLITNYSGIEANAKGAYVTVGTAFSAQRHSYFQVSGERDFDFEKHHEDKYRLAVHTYLQSADLPFQNGDTVLFNTTGAGLTNMANILFARNWIADEIPIVQGQLARLQVETVASSLEYFCPEGRRKIGKPCFNLIILPDGEMKSTTGLDAISGV